MAAIRTLFAMLIPLAPMGVLCLLAAILSSPLQSQQETAQTQCVDCSSVTPENSGLELSESDDHQLLELPGDRENPSASTSKGQPPGSISNFRAPTGLGQPILPLSDQEILADPFRHDQRRYPADVKAGQTRDFLRCFDFMNQHKNPSETFLETCLVEGDQSNLADFMDDWNKYKSGKIKMKAFENEWGGDLDFEQVLPVLERAPAARN